MAAGPILCANAATWASTNDAASRESTIVARAIRRARQPGSSRPTTRAQTFGSRWASSTASPTNAAPTSVGTPSAEANSASENDATNGAPGPATGTGVSPKQAASTIDSAGCRSAQATASSSW